MKKPPYIYCTPTFFDSTIILIFSSLILYWLSRIIRVKLKWIKVQTVDDANQNFRNRIENPKLSKPPICKTKKRPFVYSIISKDKIFHILYSSVESSESIGFDTSRYTVIVDNSANAHI